MNDLEISIFKLINYYDVLHKLLITYMNELINILDSKIIKNKLENTIKTLENLNIQISKDNIKKKINFDSIINLLSLYHDLLKLNNEFKVNIDLIQNINIFDEKTLLSDTSKNNINQNKTVIIDLYLKIKNKLFTRLEKITKLCIDNFILDINIYYDIHNYYTNNPAIINIYVEIIKNYLLINNKNLKKNNELYFLIMYNNHVDKNRMIIKNLNIDIKYNINNFKDFDYLFKKSPNIFTYNSLIKKFPQYNVLKSYENLNNLLSNIQNSNIPITNDLSTKNLSNIQKFVNNLYKIDNIYLSISIIETSIESFNYNYKNLLNNKITIVKDSGINNNYLNKTKTIINHNEFINLDNSKLEFENDIYISNINKIYNINNFVINKLKNSSKDKIRILLSSKNILIFKLLYPNKKTQYHIMQYKNEKNIYLNFLQIKEFLQNKPDYFIENYNIYKNEKILQNINNNNLLQIYKNKITSDYKNIQISDNLELKNTIINSIKKEIKVITEKNKSENIEKIINIINDKLFIYIKKKNSIEFTSEIYLTYYSNINSLNKKIKKELTDNYNSNLLFNIDTILNNIYSNIITINDNILDKYYLLQL